MPQKYGGGQVVRASVETVGRAVREPVQIKGFRAGLCLVVDEDAPLDQVLATLRRRLGPARRFFSGARVRLETGGRVATWAQWTALVDVVQECGLTVELGPGPADAGTSLAGRPGAGEAASGDGGHRAIIGSARLSQEPSEAAGFPAGRGLFSRQPGSRTLLVRRTLRSGQRVAYDGNVVVLGDVNPGAEVIASGDIVVVGALRGVAHAGARGDAGAVVVALRLMPLQLRIAHRVARAPEGGTEVDRGPELARIRDDGVEVQPYYAAVMEEGTGAWPGG